LGVLNVNNFKAIIIVFNCIDQFLLQCILQELSIFVKKINLHKDQSNNFTKAIIKSDIQNNDNVLYTYQTFTKIIFFKYYFKIKSHDLFNKLHFPI